MMTEIEIQVPGIHAPEFPSHPSFPALKGFGVLALSFAALKVAVEFSTQAGEGKHSTAFYLACAWQLLAFALIMSAYYFPPGAEFNLQRILLEVGICFATTSFFLSFSLLLPFYIWVQAIYWGVYVGVIIIIIHGYYKGIDAVI